MRLVGVVMKRQQLEDGLTVGQRTAKRGHVPARPWDKDFAEAQLRLICDLVQANPWVQSQLGANVTVQVSSVPNKCLRFDFVRDK